MAVTALPIPPTRNDPLNFASRADIFLPALVVFADELNITQNQINTSEANALQSAQNAQNSADNALNARDDAEFFSQQAQFSLNSALDLANTNSTSTTSLTVGTGSRSLTIQSGKAYVGGQSVVIASSANPSANLMFGQITSYNPSTGALVVNVISVRGSGTFASWIVALSSIPELAQPSVIRQEITTASTLGFGNRANLIDVNGTFTLSFAAASTLTDGWFCYIRNMGTGDVTLDPSGSETIDGRTTFIMYPGEVRLVQCNGTLFRSFVLSPFSKTFESSGTFVKPPGYSRFGVLIWSGGASGGKGSLGIGGGGGGCFYFDRLTNTISDSETVIVGAGGSPVTQADLGGNAGGDSVFAGVTVIGAGTPAPNGCAQGGSVSRDGQRITTTGSDSGFGAPAANVNTAGSSVFGGASARVQNIASPGGSSVYGGGSGASIGGSGTAAGGTSVFGGNGGAASATGNGTAGTAPGGGGGATSTGTQSGAGARGEVRIWGI